ncbi:hypothetical protein KCP77_19060 [Salmonella enterica subsp. enterica]|nr:hypothetical protein KCP77_19060 [Salmonella enterica subsp. enterica]
MLTGFVGSGTTPCSKFSRSASGTPHTVGDLYLHRRPRRSGKVRWYCRLPVYANSLQTRYPADSDDGGELDNCSPSGS